MVHESHKKTHIGQVLKWHKINVSNIFYHFLFVVSRGNRASKMSEKFRIDREIVFQNISYTKCINVIINSIGPSTILRSWVFKTNNLLMQVKSTAECSRGAFCNTFDLHLNSSWLSGLCFVYF